MSGRPLIWIPIVSLCAAVSPRPAAAERPGAAGGAAKPQASVSADEVSLGQVFYLFIEVKKPPGVEVNLPASLPLGETFEETDRVSYEERAPDGTVAQTFELAVMAFEVGEVEIPPIPVTYASGGEVRREATDPVPLRVASVVGEGDGELRDIAPPVRVYKRDWTLLYVLGGVGAVFCGALLGIGVARLFRRMPRRRGRAPRTAGDRPRAPPAAEALERLEQLEGSGALDDDDHKPAYHTMSEVLRAYLGRWFDFPALDLTTAETFAYLSETAEGAAAAERIRGWLEHCDAVKFAGYPASAEEARRSLYEARLFVEETRPREGRATPAGPTAEEGGVA